MLAKLLDLQMLDELRFLAQNHQQSFRNTLFGGQVLAQALMAAGRTVTGRPPNSMHAYFLRAGSADCPIEYQVSVLRDGRSVSTRTVAAVQKDELIFTVSASFHAPESGYRHQMLVPEDSVPAETLIMDAADTGDQHLVQQADEALGTTPLEIAAYDHSLFDQRAHSHSNSRFWVRSASHLRDEPLRHYCALAFASDIGLLASALLPHDTSLFAGAVFPASMDHSVWFHEQPNFEQWHQYLTTSPWAGHGRGLCQGSLFSSDNRLVASVAQEGLIRPLGC